MFRHDRRGTPVWDEIVDEIGIEPLIEDFEDTPEGISEFDKANDVTDVLSPKHRHFEHLQMKELRGQRASSLIGNQSTGSIFLALMSSLECDYQKITPSRTTNWSLWVRFRS